MPEAPSMRSILGGRIRTVPERGLLGKEGEAKKGGVPLANWRALEVQFSGNLLSPRPRRRSLVVMAMRVFSSHFARMIFGVVGKGGESGNK